jgi:hypothetical protein
MSYDLVFVNLSIQKFKRARPMHPRVPAMHRRIAFYRESRSRTLELLQKVGSSVVNKHCSRGVFQEEKAAEKDLLAF